MSYPPTSRYYNIETATFDVAQDRTVRYLRRRFVPQPERFSLLQTYVVVQGDRMDNVTAKFLTDPQQFWRLCDANRAMRPEGLMKMGKQLRITLPEGIPGTPNA